MFALVFFAQTAALVAFHLGALAIARRVASGGRAGRERMRTVAAVMVVAGPLALALTDASGGTFLAAQLLTTLGFLGLVAAEGGLAPRTLVLVHAVSTAVLAHFLAWRGLTDAGRATPVLRYVLADFVHQLTFPLLGLATPREPGPFAENVRALLVSSTTGIAEQPLVPLAMLGYAVLVVLAAQTARGPLPVTARALAPRPALALGLALAWLAVSGLATRWLPAGLASWGHAVLLPPLVVEAATLLAPLRRTLVAPRAAAGIGLAVVVVLPELLDAAAALGVLGLFVPRASDDGRVTLPPSSLPRLAMGTGALLLPLAVLCAAGYARTVPSMPAWLAPRCGGLRITRQASAVRFAGPSGSLAVDVEERPLTGTIDDADATCRAHGGHVCTSDELFVACACDLGGDHARVGLDPVPPRALVERAERTCGPSPDARCESDHGLVGLLGGRSELTADGPFPGVHLVAGPNSVQRENWMAHCAYRGLASDASLAATRPSFVGFRCCRAEGGGRGDATR